MSVFVLWEDRAISPIAKFGPHVFLTACVAQRMSRDRHELRRSERLDGKSCAGNANVLRELQHAPLWNSDVDVVAVLDTDELHDRISGIASRRTISDAADARWAESVATEIRKQAPPHAQPRLEICFLDRNLETLLEIIGHDGPERAAALAKRPLDRDKLMQRAAADDSLIHKACTAMPSWEHLVATVTRLLTPAR